MRVVCYPQPRKRRALRVCDAFAIGSGGIVMPNTPPRLCHGIPFFYGVRPPWKHLWVEAQRSGQPWLYADNAFLRRGVYFRVAWNKVQSADLPADYERLDALSVDIKPWRRSGSHVLVCLQSDEFMSTVAGGGMPEIETDRPVRIRHKSSPVPLSEDLRDCWCVVTWSSAAGIDAILAGVPAISFGQSVIPKGNIEAPPMDFDRREWAARLAANQWTLPEFISGEAWAHLKEGA